MTGQGHHHPSQDPDVVQGLEAPYKAGQLVGNMLILVQEGRDKGSTRRNTPAE